MSGTVGCDQWQKELEMIDADFMKDLCDVGLIEA